MENVRNCVNVDLCNDEVRAKKMIALPTFKHVEIVNENLVMIHRLQTKIHQNKPIYMGYVVLAHMYRFHYEVIVAKYGLDCKLLFTDTDSLCYHIKTPHSVAS